MAPGRKLGEGCWTCRLRRKRCDSVRPVCGSCQTLDITCHSGEARPSWMDGAVRQKRMSDTIKASIKQNALLRREKRLLSHESHGLIVAEKMNISHAPDPTHYTVVGNALSTTSISTSPPKPTIFQSSVGQSEDSPSSFTIISQTSGSITQPTGPLRGSSGPLQPATPIQMQLGSVMIYLDHVFPFLFPFYQPPLIETGRQWLLGLLCQNETSFHIAVSLAAYFFSLIPQTEEQEMHDDCKALVLNRLVEQMDMAVVSIQDTVSAVSHNEVQSPLLSRIRVMEEITQLLIVEVTVQTNVDWEIHLTPALALFNEIFESHGILGAEPSLATLLSALPSPFPAGTPHHKPLPNTADQSALVFFVSLLLFIDILASTALGAPPTLQSYHRSLLSSNADTKSYIRLEAVVGCQIWPLVAIGDISALCAWKRDAKRNGSFEPLNFSARSNLVEQALDEGLASLNANATCSQPEKASPSWLQGYYSRHDRAIDHTSIAKITKIWAHAARVYLSICVSGWHSTPTSSYDSVNEVLSLLRNIESPAQLRSLAWPFCVAGCMALPSHEQEFRDVVGKMGQLREFGTISNALRIMEAVWTSRETFHAESLDLDSVLSILGSPALLI